MSNFLRMSREESGSQNGHSADEPTAKKSKQVKVTPNGTSVYPIIRQRGYYSDIISQAHLTEQEMFAGPEVASADVVRKLATNDFTPNAASFECPASDEYLAVADERVRGKTTEIQKPIDFTQESFQPKVQMPFYTIPGTCNRKVEIERRKREFATIDFVKILAASNVSASNIMPRKPLALSSIMERAGKDDKLAFLKQPSALPLHLFDNTEYDCRLPDEWLELGRVNRQVRKPVPARALLPTRDNVHANDPRDEDIKYDWFNIGVLDYDVKSQTYLVMKCDSEGRICDKFGNTIINGGRLMNGKRLLMPTMYWIPRIRLCYLAEDPRIYAKRVIEAFEARRQAEALMRYELYIDCMPTDGVGEMDQPSLRRIVSWARSAPNMAKSKVVDDCLQVLEKETGVDYCRAMNQVMFDRNVRGDPQTFAFVTLPNRIVKPVDEKGTVPVPEYPFDERFDKFAFHSLLTQSEAIDAFTRIRAECNKVIGTSLLHVSLSKYMRLEEFEQTQSQMTTQTALYLKDSYITTLKNAIRTSLRDVGKGWFSLEESNWEVYQKSKLKQFMETTKFIMQDTLRFLVQDSLSNFTQMVNDACCSVLSLDEAYADWDTDLLTSRFKPKKNPLFLLDLVLDTSGSHYSVPLPNFEVSLHNLFNKAITSTHNVPILEKFILEKIFWSGTPLLESVGEHEPQVELWRASLRSAINKALLPMNAYARKFEPYLDLANLDVNVFIKKYESVARTPQEVRDEINVQLHEKDVIEAVIPSSITIGPFQVNTEGVRQNLSKKRKAIAAALLELLAKILRKQADDVCEEFRAISRKLFEKSNNIEELVEQREWMKTVPDKLLDFEDAIQKVVTDYDLLDEFWCNLSQDDFNLKWTTVGWPNKVLQQIDQVNKQLDDDEERFRKQQLQDVTGLNDRLDTLTMQVAGLSAYTDMNKAHDFAAEVRKLNKNLKECQQLSQTYNSRERIFASPLTSYERLAKLLKDFEPYRNLWTGASDWMKWYDSWMNDPLQSIDAENVEKNVNETFKTMHKSIKLFQDFPGVADVAQTIKNQIEAFKPNVPLIQGLRNPGMRSRHWEQLSKDTGVAVVLKANLNFSKCLEMGLQNHTAAISKIAEVAGKEYAIEQALVKMEGEWQPLVMDIIPYKETNTYIMKITDEVNQLLDDHIVMTQSMSFSPYKKAFEERISTWESKLRTVQDVIDEWANCQRAWLYLEPIFSSEDINRQLPVESKRYQTMERTWRKIMKNAKENPAIISFCPDNRLLEQLRECNKLLDQVQKGLSEYLETKRSVFPRFYFLSDDELLEILSQSRDPLAVQPHLRKCFENIYKLQFESDMKITAMYSGEGEKIQLQESTYPTGNVEDWLLEIERLMRMTVKETIRVSLDDYKKRPRTEWVLAWPAQAVIAGSQTYWSAETTEALQKQQLQELYDLQLAQLDGLRNLINTGIDKTGRLTLSALIVIEVHARDVINNLIEEKVQRPEDFEWISQLRYYWVNDGLYVRAVNAEFEYGYEYLGNTARLVITPLTDRCYLTLTGALHLKFGGAPAGPAGTGKTETTKDLSKAMAVQCVVFNCSDQLDFMAMGKFFKGLASAGAWACFDEFNRIDIEVLSVVAQQITTIQKALIQGVDRFAFEGAEIALKASCSVFITMNPGYAGRTELPDNLKALFRPVAMMVPDYALIAEISLFSFGFGNARPLAKKIVSTFKLSSEQLSSQDHYDFGMRAVKSVISAAGNLKRQNPEMDEDLICLRAIRDVNVPKFLLDDLKLFNGIVSDLFPTTKQPPIDYGAFLVELRNVTKKRGMKDVDGFIHKCIQLYETTVVRHGLMLVGPTCSGKTRCYEVLRQAITNMKGQMSPAGVPFDQVFTFVLNPKSITMGQLYGEYDLLTHEWTDGILSTLIRQGVNATDNDKRWYVLDGPVDAIWIENMNSVLDDNKKLCLSSGEIIKITDNMTLMFEVQDLAVASPATVSRCGMVYLEPGILGLDPFVECWLNKLPDMMFDHKSILENLFKLYLEECITFVRKNMVELVATTDGNLTFSLLKMMDCFLRPFVPTEVLVPGAKQRRTEQIKVPDEVLQKIPQFLEIWFYFSLVWSVGATSNNEGRQKFDQFLRQKMQENNAKLPFPTGGSVFDYRVEDGGLTRFGKEKKEDEEEEEGEPKEKTVRWAYWLEGAANYTVPPETKFSDIIVPTIDTVRYTQIVEMLLQAKKPVICVGPTGTGKTLSIADKLTRGMPKDYLPEFIVFSAKTSANQTQDLIDSKLDKRRKGVFGPPLGKYFVFFIDDLNMPAYDQFGSQPPIELLRQWLDFSGWYDRKAIGEFRNLVDVNLICAMGPPGGGRNAVTARMLRHFNFLAFTEMEDASMKRIFGTILASWLSRTSSLNSHTDNVVDACIKVYLTIQKEMLPTPSRSHYTFNLRDLSKVFQGILMMEPAKAGTVEDLLRLWYHESCRVYQDRLINEEDRQKFREMLNVQMQSTFGISYERVVTREPLLYADFMVPNVENKLYIEITDYEKMQRVLEDYMDDYLQINATQSRLVLFTDAIKHICRISRVIRQPLGNALLLGMGGSGRRSLTKLAAHMSEYDLFQIELSKNYSNTDWREDLKKVMMKAGLESRSVVFLFSDTQIKQESFLEDLNNILNSGDVPNIYGFDELEQVFKAMKPLVPEGMQPTKTNMFSIYTKRVRSNLHLVLSMSPIGDLFRARLRQFPALVNCCTLDWYSEWPDEALQSVATRFLGDVADLPVDDNLQNALVIMFQEIHQSVVRNTERYRAELSRRNYVTPTSYLELLSTFSKMYVIKKNEIVVARTRTKGGLDKLLYSAEEVAKLQEELKTMKPLLEAAVLEATTTMTKIAEDSKAAEETRSVVSKQEQEASTKAKACAEIAADAQRDLDEALPALDSALASLQQLNKNDVVEVRAMQRPPAGVNMVMEAVCIMKGVKPKMVQGEKPGEKKADYWEPGKSLLQDPGQFLSGLFTFDKDNISDATIKLIQPFIDNEAFQPAAIAKVSKACTSICMWVRAMYKYHFVSKTVAPKREALKNAEGELAVVQRVLDDARRRLGDVEAGIAALQAKYEECIRKKDELEQKSAECTARLQRAGKLIGGLADEKGRWEETIARLDKLLSCFVGDVVVSAGYVAYLGPFTAEYRARMAADWRSRMAEVGCPFTEDCSLISTFSDPVKIRSWQIDGLPKDNLSIENGVISQFSRRWPLFIDPQGQANKWIKNMEKNNGMDTIKLSDRDFVRTLENAVRFGKPCLLENVGEELDPVLESILLKQTFKQGGQLSIKLGDAVIPYHEDFKFYMTTKLPNPHYLPEISIKVTLVNFTLSPSGLQDQLLGIVVAEERPDLEEAKNQLIVQNAKMKQELKELEDKILQRLSASEGNPVDDIDLIASLEQSKVKSLEIKAKVAVSEQTERDIDETRAKYIPVAVQAQILFFCVADLRNIDPMYQYSLEWFINIFLNSITNAERADNLPKRIQNINSYFTFSLYSNVCRSLFEKHKLMFAFLISIRFLQNQEKINMDEWRFLLAGGTTRAKEMANPYPDWLPERSWGEILCAATLPIFASLPDDVAAQEAGFQLIYDSPDPHRETLPEPWNTRLDEFQRMIVLKCLRPGKLTLAMQDFVALQLGSRFVEPQTSDLGQIFKESSPTTPLIFVLSQGTDPAADLYKFAEEMRFSKKLNAISLGQGQGPVAESLMRSAMERGKWVFFQNCHLSPSWMPSLERLVEQIDPDKVHRDFRLWLTSMPSPTFPVYILQNGSKMTIEPPRGIKANLLKCFNSINDDYLNSCGDKFSEKNITFRHLLLSLSLFHGVLLERRKFGPLGYNIAYEFTDGDLRICMSQLRMFLLEYEQIPYKVLKYTTGEINYGGRVTDDWDRRCVRNVLQDFYSPIVVDKEFKYSQSGVYRQIDPESDYAGYMSYIKGLPINDPPEIFGLHENANISYAQTETFNMLNNLLLLQPKAVSTGSGKSREETVEDLAKKILSEVQNPYKMDEIMKKYPVMYEQSMNTVLVQEVIRYNRLLRVIRQSLNDLLKAIKGFVVLSQELEQMMNSLYDNKVPVMWASKAYPSLKPLASWVEDLKLRLDFIGNWIDSGIPSIFWISGFFFPQAFLTGTLQNFARKKVVSIDSVSFDFKVMKDSRATLAAGPPPEDGCYIYGLFLEGSRWDPNTAELGEAEPKKLFTEMPCIWLVPIANRKPPTSGVYECPVYKTLTRAGTLSTTGHSTNFVFTIDVPTSQSQQHWIKRGVALICALNY